MKSHFGWNLLYQFTLSFKKKNGLQVKFEGIWSELRAKNSFQRQSWRKYLRETLGSVK